MFWSKKLALGTNPNPDRQDIWMVEKIRSNPYERTLTPNSGSGGLSPSENYKRSQQVRIRIFFILVVTVGYVRVSYGSWLAIFEV